MNRSLQYLLDTDTCIYLLNGNTQIKSRVAQIGVEVLAVAIPTVCELYFGAYNSTQIDENLMCVRDFLSSPGPIILPIDDTAADQFGKLKAELRRQGQLIGDIDLQIASVAANHNLKVVTNNTNHFSRISEVTVENWLT